MDDKRLTADNFLIPDARSQITVVSDADGHRRTLAAVDWAEGITSLDIGTGVPADLQETFANVKAIVIYGYFWYPLFTMAGDEILRLADDAVALKSQFLGIPRKENRTFHDRLAWLAQRGVLSHDDVFEWQALRDLRDHFPRSRDAGLTGTWVMTLLERVAAAVTRLFADATSPD